MLFAYRFEANPQFGERVHAIQKSMEARLDMLCISAYVLGEVLEGPLKIVARARRQTRSNSTSALD